MHRQLCAHCLLKEMQQQTDCQAVCPAVDVETDCCVPLLHACMCAADQVTGQEKYDLPVPLIRSAHQHLVFAREEAARTAKELAELKASRVQHIPPSTWIKREQKYKMDQEKYEHMIGQLRQRTEGLERELAVLREGSNVRPLEEKIQVCYGADGQLAATTAVAACGLAPYLTHVWCSPCLGAC